MRERERVDSGETPFLLRPLTEKLLPELESPTTAEILALSLVMAHKELPQGLRDHLLETATPANKRLMEDQLRLYNAGTRALKNDTYYNDVIFAGFMQTLSIIDVDHTLHSPRLKFINLKIALMRAQTELILQDLSLDQICQTHFPTTPQPSSATA